MPSFVTVPLAAATQVTPRSRLVSLDLQDVTFTFRPGQAVLVGLRGRGSRRPFSIACSPEQAETDRRLELLVATDASGESGIADSSVVAGSLAELEGPIGSFVFPETLAQSRVLFVGGGTGIAPLRSMAFHVLRQRPTVRVGLLYSARRADEFAFIDEFRALAQSGRLEMEQTVTRDDDRWQGQRGRIRPTHFETLVRDPADTICFVCGPPAMVSGAITTLGELGVPEQLIRTDEWASRGSARTSGSP